MSLNGSSFSFDDDEDEEEEWFGEDSPFESGEELAAALVSMAGGDASALFAGLGEDPPEGDGEATEYSEFETFGTSRQPEPSPWGGGHIMSQKEQLDAVLARVQPTNHAPVPTTWSSRNSAKVLKLTAQHMARLRNQAIEIAWQEAALAVKQRDPKRRRGTAA